MVSLDALRPGEALIYFEGAEPLARLRVKQPGDPQVAAADRAWDLALAGQADLIQRRYERGFQYLAVGRRQVDRRPVLPVLASQGVRAA
jgi:hypothetical protein